MEVKPGYKQSEVGVIPEDWEVKRFGKLYAEPSRNGVYKSAEFQGRGTRIVNMGEMFGLDFISDQEMSRVSLTPKEIATSGLRDGDLLFGRRSVVPAGAGKCSLVVKPLESLIFESSIIRVRLEQAEANPLFHYYFFASSTGRSVMGIIISGTNVKGIRASELRELKIPRPPLPEQRAIAAALSDVDGLLGGLDRLIAKKRDLKQAAMQQLLTGQTRLPGFHGEWMHAQVQDVVAGFFCGPSPTCEERNVQDDEEWGVLKTTAATKENGWDWSKHKTLPRVFWNKTQIELKKGDVIVTKAGPRHRVGVTAWIDFVPPRIIPSGKMIALRPRPEKVVPLMLATAISARDAQSYLDQRTTGMAESQVNFENIALLEAPITIPCIEEQTAIATVLSEMDGELAVLEQRREKTRALKQAMMQELLTGRTRLV